MSSVDNIVTKHLITAEIQVLEVVITLALAHGLDKSEPSFVAKLRQFRAKCDEDLVNES